MNTSRWRKRRNASNAITVAQRSTPTMPTDPVEATTASMKPVMPEAQPGQPPHHRVVPDDDRHAQAAPGRAEGDPA